MVQMKSGDVAAAEKLRLDVLWLILMSCCKCTGLHTTDLH